MIVPPTRLLVVLLLLFASSRVFAQGRDLGPAERFYRTDTNFSFNIDSKKTGGAVSWAAARQEYIQEKVVVLEGDVKIHYQDVDITADRITHNLETKDLIAEGNVILDQGPRRLSANRLEYNLESKTGTLYEAKASLEPSMYFRGEKIEKLDEDTYRMTNGVFTSCDIEDPAWSFRVASGTITMNDYARLNDLSFRAKRLPLFWAPYILWPTKSDRSRGVLIPKIGFSNRFGAYVGNAYFLPVGPSFDSTIYADVYGKGYYAAGTEIRYVPSESTRGRLEAYLVRNPDLDELRGYDELEWKAAYTHTQNDLPGGFRGVIDIQEFSSLEFFKRFERNFNLNTISSIYSTAYLTKNRPRYSVNIRTDRREHFLGPGEALTFEQLPTAELNWYPMRIGNSPLYATLESSLSHLRTGAPDDDDPETREDASYWRADLYPTVSMQLRTPPWLSVKPELSFRQTYYTSRRDPASPNRSIEDEPVTRSYGQAQLEVVGPSFSKIFNGDIGGFNKFKHLIEPRARYLHTTDIRNQDLVVRFDTVDSPYLPIVRDSLEYSVTQRVIAREKKENASAREIMSFSVRQTASLADPLVRASSGAESRFSPLTANLRVNPYQSFTIDANATAGSLSRRLDQMSVSANISAAQSYLNLTWFASFAHPDGPTRESSQYRLTTGAPIIRDRLRADLQLYYDAERGRFLEQRYLAGFYASCYNIALELRNFSEYRGAALPTRNTDYLVSVSLKNVGTFVDLRGSFDNIF